MNPSRLRFTALAVSILTLTLLTPTFGPTVNAHFEPSSVETTNACNVSTLAYITWAPEEVICPICQTKNTFMVPMSYGSYIYHYPSKYQLIYWPYTDSPSWHSCKKCRYTAFMGDFKDVPKEKIPDLQKMLQSVSLPAQKEVPAGEKGWNQPYMTITSSDRLLVAEKVYRTLGREETFWAHFYRVLAWHLDHDSKTDEAAEARKKALAILEGWLPKEENAGVRKELLYVCGAMRHFLKQDPEALKLFNEAQKVTYNDPKLDKEKNEGYDGYLSALIKEYIQKIEKGEGPRDKP